MQTGVQGFLSLSSATMQQRSFGSLALSDCPKQWVAASLHPMFHTAALYDGFRRDTPNRALILSRDAYLGIQKDGVIV